MCVFFKRFCALASLSVVEVSHLNDDPKIKNQKHCLKIFCFRVLLCGGQSPSPAMQTSFSPHFVCIGCWMDALLQLKSYQLNIFFCVAHWTMLILKWFLTCIYVFLSSKIFCDSHATHFTIFCCIPKISAYTVLGKKKECPLNLNLKIFCTASFWLELHCNALVNWLQPFFLAIITNLPNFIQFWKKRMKKKMHTFSNYKM